MVYFRLNKKAESKAIAASLLDHELDDKNFNVGRIFDDTVIKSVFVKNFKLKLLF
jgi:hypothetical protein